MYACMYYVYIRVFVCAYMHAYGLQPTHTHTKKKNTNTHIHILLSVCCSPFQEFLGLYNTNTHVHIHTTTQIHTYCTYCLQLMLPGVFWLQQEACGTEICTRVRIYAIMLGVCTHISSMLSC